jgi:hypothetical protein
VKVIWEFRKFGSFAAELRISAHAPALPTLKMQVVPTHHTPDLALAHNGRKAPFDLGIDDIPDYPWPPPLFGEWGS